MEDNPFSSLIKTIGKVSKGQIPATFRFGTVITDNPIKLDVAGTIQDKSSVLKNSLIDGLVEGDTVLMVPVEDEQRYIILCKVVSL